MRAGPQIARRCLPAALTFIVASAIALPAFADFCSGKQNGLWCNGDTLVNCHNNSISSSNKCPNGCQSMPTGVPDKCKDAPANFCTGKQSGLWCDGNNLVNCQGGKVSSSSTCKDGCQSMPAGTPDKCKAAPNFCTGKQSGLWCDGDKLVNCQGGKVSSSSTCQYGCESKPVGTNDVCKSAPNNFCTGKQSGLWCDGNKLVNCQNGQISSSSTCKDGCQSMPAGTPDKCKTASGGGFCQGKQNGLWCNGDDLVTCQNDQIASSSKCANGCESMPVGTPDSCKSGGGSSSNGGLSLCNPFDPSKTVTCGFGCYSGHMGSDYACADGTSVFSPINGKVIKTIKTVPGQLCSPNFGNYIRIQQGEYEVFLAHLRKDIKVNEGDTVKAGQHVAYASNTGYTLTSKNGQWVCQQGGGYHLHLETRKNGKAFNPYASSDVSWGSCDKVKDGGGTVPTGFCAGKPSGFWCDGDKLKTCKADSETGSLKCDHGCQSNPSGVPDACKPAPGFCGSKSDGKWCDGSKLVTCSGAKITSEAVCAHGCQQNSAGTADACKPPPDWCADKADSIHCDGPSAVTCKAAKTASKESCKNGCGELGPGKGAGCLPDVDNSFCGAKSDGDWCGDGGVLVTCKTGKKAASEVCQHGCDGMGPGPDDACKKLPDNTDDCAIKSDGSWCNGNAVLTCAGGKTVQGEACKDGCDPKGTVGNAVCKVPVVRAKDFCDGKASGWWCDDARVVQCNGGLTVKATLCPYGCETKGDGSPDACKPAARTNTPFCDGKINGAWCETKAGQSTGKLVHCFAGKSASTTECSAGCLSAPKPAPHVCAAATEFCTGKSDGAWCSDTTRVVCAAQKQVSASLCGLGCEGVGGLASCQQAGPKSCGLVGGTGNVCVQGVLVTCAGGYITASETCINGCAAVDGAAPACVKFAISSATDVAVDTGVCSGFSGDTMLPVAAFDQTQFTDQLGECKTATIKQDGAMITALAMVYAYFGLPRTVAGVSDNAPPMENSWRLVNDGYRPCSGGAGKCCARLDRNPSTLGWMVIETDGAACATADVAKKIAEHLAQQRPVLAAVHWTEGLRYQHWVVIVGVKDGTLRVVDPSGGATVSLADGKLGNYSIDAILLPFFSSELGGLSIVGADGKAMSKDPVPAVIGEQGFSVPSLGADANPDGGAAVAKTSGDSDSGCAASNVGSSAPERGDLGWLLFVAAALVVFRRRQTASPRLP